MLVDTFLLLCPILTEHVECISGLLCNSVWSNKQINHHYQQLGYSQWTASLCGFSTEALLLSLPQLMKLF